MKKPAAKKRGGAGRGKDHGRMREILGLFLLALALLVTLSFASYPEPNLLRGFGDKLAELTVPMTLGRGPSLVIPLLLFIWSATVLLRWKKSRSFFLSLSLAFLAFWLAFLIYLFDAPYPNADHSGLIGLAFGDWIYNFMGPTGAWIVWLLVVVSGLVWMLSFRPSVLLAAALKGGESTFLWLKNHPLPKLNLRGLLPQPKPKLAAAGSSADVADDVNLDDLNVGEESAEEGEPEDQPPWRPEEPALEIVTRNQTLPLKFREPDEPKRSGEYVLPPLSILSDPPPESPDEPEELRAKAKRLQSALADFGVGARVVKVNPGPVITRFDLEPDPGVKVNRISALADDLALVLRARAIRIQAPIPGQGAVGVEIPNRQPSTVVLKSVVSHPSFQNHKSPLAIALGQTAAGDPYVSDLGRMPHLLVAGTTGSGKSVCLNAIIASLLLRNPPEKLQFVIIDPKKLEMSGYARLARHHLMVSPELDEEVITTPANAVLALGGVEIEMARRYDLLAGAGVRNIEEFNNLIAKGDATTPGGKPLHALSYLIVVIDELADLMMISAKEIEEPIARLAQMARAVGIHLIVATQRPSVDVITGVIKANFPARLAFQVASKVDSRTILDANGADTLLGNGDALFIPPGRGTPERIHSCYVSISEIDAIVTHIENQPNDFYRHPLTIPHAGGEGMGPDGEMSGELDEFFDDAIRIVIHQGQASVSILQRRLKIGYARAGRLIDQLERAGIVGPFDGSKARDVLVDENWFNAHGSGITPRDLE
jgi:S-DNA-T family DNA segregation ATPase FtsK/SpoIIIE